MHLSKIPKILSTIEDIQNPQTTVLKNEMKKFIINIQQQFDNVITSYEKQLSLMQKQKLKISQRNFETKSKTINKTTLNKNNNYETHYKGSMKNVDQSRNIDDIQQWILPLNSNDFNLSTSSPFYRTARISSKDGKSPWRSIIKTHDSSPIGLRKGLSFSVKHNENQTNYKNNQFVDNHQNKLSTSIKIPSNERSQYQRQSQMNKQRQQEIVHCLETHQKNLDQITCKMMGMIGRASRQNDDEQNFYDEQQNLSIISNNLNQSRLQQQDHHNRSLSNICDSLDKSFVSQKTRKAKLKKKMIEQENKRKNYQLDLKNQQFRKQRAIKNLLYRLRQNAMSTQPPQTVKGSKLLTVGNNNYSLNSKISAQASHFPIRRNSKVLINPVPVQSPLQTRKNQQSPSFIEKRPTSILKQSSNVLTRSISGISAIAFDQ